MTGLVAFPAHALLIVEERLREQETEGARMPEGMALDELALRLLITATLTQQGPRSDGEGADRPPVKAAPEEGRAKTGRYGGVSVR